MAVFVNHLFPDNLKRTRCTHSNMLQIPMYIKEQPPLFVCVRSWLRFVRGRFWSLLCKKWPIFVIRTFAHEQKAL